VAWTERFWRRVEKTDSCWLWRGPLEKSGYGRFGDGRNTHGIRSCHRISWLIHYGKPPLGMCVLHKCDVPNCVNPSHLWLGTNAENTLDRTRKRRSASWDRNGSRTKPENLVRGIDQWCCKSCPEEVSAIRERYKYRSYTMCRLSAEFGLKVSTINKILKMVTWKHVP